MNNQLILCTRDEVMDYLESHVVAQVTDTAQREALAAELTQIATMPFGDIVEQKNAYELQAAQLRAVNNGLGFIEFENKAGFLAKAVQFLGLISSMERDDGTTPVVKTNDTGVAVPHHPGQRHRQPSGAVRVVDADPALG